MSTSQPDPDSGLEPFLQLTAESVVDLLGFRGCLICLNLPDSTTTLVQAGTGIDPEVPQPELVTCPLTDAEGGTVGFLAALPGSTPTPAQVDLVADYAGQAEMAVRVSIAVRHDLEQIRAADASRAAVRRLAASPDEASAWPEIVERIAAAYQASDVLVHSLGLDGSASLIVTRAATRPDDAVLDVITGAARTAWHQREADLFRADPAALAGLSRHHLDEVRAWSTSAGLGESTLLVPIGAAEDCLGALLITRPPAGAAWTQTEIRGATALGADLGLVLYNRRTLETQGRYLAELQAIDDYQDDLLDTVTAMLRAPIARIGAQIPLLDGAEPVTAAGDIGADIRQMTTLVDDLLFFSRVTDPRRARAADVINMATLTRQVADQVFRPHDPISLRVRSSGAFPLVRGDGRELTQLLTAVITNAVRFTTHGAVTVTVASGASEAEITVTDTGSGISAEDQPRVFEEFFRGSNAVGVPGNGLGLAIAARIVEHHGGRIDLTSVPGEGTSVRIHLPQV